MPRSDLASLVIVCSCRPHGQLLQSFGQYFELFVCAEFVESVNADLNRSGVVVGYVVDVFGFAHDHLCKRVVSHQSLVALHLAARMSLLARLLASDCEVVHTLLLKYEDSPQRQEAMQRLAKGAVQVELARTYGLCRRSPSAAWRRRALSRQTGSASARDKALTRLGTQAAVVPVNSPAMA
jgi:hypothetical protein